MKTQYLIEIDHREPLPEGMTDALAARAYGFINAHGGDAKGVVVKLVLPVEGEGDES